MSDGRTLRALGQTSLTEVPGVSARLLDKLGAMSPPIESVLDLIGHYPRRYHDRTRQSEIAELEVGAEATIVAEVQRISSRVTRNRKKMVEAVVEDATGLLNLVFFNQPWREKQLPTGTEVALYGKLDVYRGKRQMTNPVVDILGQAGDTKTGVVMPIYPQSGKADVSSWEVQPAVALVLDWVGAMSETIPQPVLEEMKLVDRTTAYRDVHAPTSMRDAQRAQRRLRFDEFLRMQVGLVARKRAIEAEASGIAHTVDGELVDRFLGALPFLLTGDQEAAIAAIRADMARPIPMHRLLQGEVGSGKTLVAITALLMAVQGGYQGALMAPTEVLAEQLHAVATATLSTLVVPSESTLLAERPVTVALLTNKVGAADRRKIAAGLTAGDVDIIVGTHALLYGDAPFTKLGLAVIDEQHRFGVEQRSLLRGLGDSPDVLVMTATPIPRTAAMLVYGDLDRTELRQMPPGRTPVVTEVVGPGPTERKAAYDRLREEIAAGHQAFVVCPLVEGSPKIEAKAATEEFEELAGGELFGYRLGLLHGQMKSAEKESAMNAFRAGETQVLVATTVIEVGVDVPNATVMIVEDADRFGLSQLHQLRGRVGRGGDQAWCFLFADPSTPDGEARMAAMEESTDGFLLAERDLEIRGSGQVFGERQAGLGDLKLGKLPRDEKYVLFARTAAGEILDDDPGLRRNRPLADEVEDLLGDDVEFLFKS
ncbi:MAG: ATP-dependent DNA helicase RecG [Acidimicrobiia bacterium]